MRDEGGKKRGGEEGIIAGIIPIENLLVRITVRRPLAVK